MKMLSPRYWRLLFPFLQSYKALLMKMTQRSTKPRMTASACLRNPGSGQKAKTEHPTLRLLLNERSDDFTPANAQNAGMMSCDSSLLGWSKFPLYVFIKELVISVIVGRSWSLCNLEIFDVLLSRQTGKKGVSKKG